MMLPPNKNQLRQTENRNLSVQNQNRPTRSQTENNSTNLSDNSENSTNSSNASLSLTTTTATALNSTIPSISNVTGTGRGRLKTSAPPGTSVRTDSRMPIDSLQLNQSRTETATTSLSEDIINRLSLLETNIESIKTLINNQSSVLTSLTNVLKNMNLRSRTIDLTNEVQTSTQCRQPFEGGDITREVTSQSMSAFVSLNQNKTSRQNQNQPERRHRENPVISRGTLAWRSSDSEDHPTEHRHNVWLNNLNRSQDETAIKIGRIISSWNITFPESERDPEQFLLLLQDLLSISGINRNLFVPCLSKIFEGPYRLWYIVNKKSWQTWKDFVRAFRYEWGIKKTDAELLIEMQELKLETSENLGELACRARLLFERMQQPPTFREQLKLILKRFNPRLSCEILNLSFRNYREFLHYVNERSYLHQTSFTFQNNRSKPFKTKLRYVRHPDLIKEESNNN